MVTHISHVTLYVRDEDEALAFYHQMLGFEKNMDQSMAPGKRWLTIRLPTQKELEIVLFNPRAWLEGAEAAAAEAQIGKQAMMIFATDDVWATYDHLKLHDARLETPVRDLPWGQDFIVADLYGNRINVVQSRPVPTAG